MFVVGSKHLVKHEYRPRRQPRKHVREYEASSIQFARVIMHKGHRVFVLAQKGTKCFLKPSFDEPFVSQKEIGERLIPVKPKVGPFGAIKARIRVEAEDHAIGSRLQVQEAFASKYTKL